MGWHGPRGNRGCCGCPPERCFDAAGNEYFQQVNELTYVLAGLPTDLIFYREERSGGSLVAEYRVTLFSFNVMEGTYIVGKDQSNCFLLTNASHSFPINYQIDKADMSGCQSFTSGTADIHLTFGDATQESHPVFAIELAFHELPTVGGSVQVTNHVSWIQTREPNPQRCDYQDLSLVVTDYSTKMCSVAGATYAGSTSTVTG